MDNFIQNLYRCMDRSRILQCIKNGLVMMIPILLTGSFALLFRSLPIPVYQQFIATFLSGAIYQLLTFIYDATFGFLAVYTTVAISAAYARRNRALRKSDFGPIFTALICFCIFSGVLLEKTPASVLGANGMFTAIFCAIFASVLYTRLEKKFAGYVRLYTDGADGEFREAVASFFPSFVVILLFALVNLIIMQVCSCNGFQSALLLLLNNLFVDAGRTLGSALFYVLVSSAFWFVGIHGENVLEPISSQLFLPITEINMLAGRAGDMTGRIYSKTFFDIFVTMGGCGTTICLLLALLLFGKRRSDRSLTRAAAIPVLLNINEILVFGLPIVFNPVLFIPFIITPLVMVLTSSFAMSVGLVPVPIRTVEWTTPILLGGYLATGSVSGAILQAANIVIGVLIYLPFVRIHDEQSRRNARSRMKELTELYQQSEDECSPLELLSVYEPLGGVARTLAEDLHFRLQSQLPSLFYQPQYDSSGNCIGAEALLRWEHPLYGIVYPPMLLRLAEETGQLALLEKAVYQSVVKDMDRLLAILSENAKISVNISGQMVQTDEFEEFLRQLHCEHRDACSHICIEITEQTALQINDALIGRLKRIHDMGFLLAIDDFSMGSTSIKYLQSSVFDLVKLDGALSRDVVNNVRSRDIIASITSLSQNFGINVLAEYVETEDQRDMLEGAGCRMYQGYLYSSAVPIEQLDKIPHKNGAKKKNAGELENQR